MKFRPVVTHALAAVAVLACPGLNDGAQARRSGPASSATHVNAEMTRGKLSPAESKPGDQVALTLTDDLRSNGELVLKKGTTITGVISNVKRLELEPQNSKLAQSLVEIEWFAPAAIGKAARQLSIALKSIIQVNTLSSAEQTESQQEFEPRGGVSRAASRVASNASRESGPSNPALLSMPSIVAADRKTTADLESALGMSPSSGQLFMVGHGEWTTPAGSKQSVEIFSHLRNDTVIVSHSKNFNISSGALMQLLVGVSK